MKPAMQSPRRRKEAGYTLLMVVFLVATMMILATAAAPNLLTQGRREKETEMIWRGQQYARAIGLYYRKFGKYPTKVEDLTRETNGVRFLRQAYTDPMNKDDGTWRFIYIQPTTGQLIGSIRQTSLPQNSLPSGILGGSAMGGGQSGLPGQGMTTAQQTGTGVPGQQTNSAMSQNSLESQPQPLTGAVMGGFIAGVGSKINKPSLRVYLGGDTYQEWEFIWTPTAQIAIPGQAPVNPNGTPPAGTDPNAPNGQPPNQQNQNPPQPPTGNSQPQPSQ
jgi:type II secretory pathway pseudopilin PulG